MKTASQEAKSGEIATMDPAVVKMEGMIALYKPRMAALLGRHMSVEQMFSIALTALGLVPKLKECTTASVLGCIMESSRLRLPAGVGPGGTWLIPRDTKGVGMECTLIVDYRAIILMMKRDSGIETVVAEAVHARDTFDYGIGANGLYLTWKPANGDRGDILGYVAASWNKAGSLTGVIYKTIDEIKKSSMAKSPAAVRGSGPWNSDPEWMFKKSVIRPLAKLNPGIESDDLSRAVAADERADLGIPQNLHLLADPTSTAHQVEETTTKTYIPPPMSKKKEGPPPIEKIDWVRAAAKKQGVPIDQFDAWLKQQLGDEAAKAKAATDAWKKVSTKKAKAKDVFALKEKAEASEGAAKETKSSLRVSMTAKTMFYEEDAYIIRDSSEPPVKYYTDQEDVYKAAGVAKKSGAEFNVNVISKTMGEEGEKQTFLWITGLA